MLVRDSHGNYESIGRSVSSSPKNMSANSYQTSEKLPLLLLSKRCTEETLGEA